MGITKTRKEVARAEVQRVIRQVFRSSQSFYTPAEAAAILGWTAGAMARAIAGGDIGGTEGDASGVRIPEREIAVLLTARYPQPEIESALGPAMASVIPEFVRLTELRVRIPRYQAVMLAKLAGSEQISVDELMSRHLLDLAGAEADWMRRRIPGFEAAMRWRRSDEAVTVTGLCVGAGALAGGVI